MRIIRKARAATLAPAWVLMPSFRLGDGVPDLGTAVGAFIDEIDLRQPPMGFDVSNVHGQQSDAARADDRSGLDFMMLDIGWHDARLLHSRTA
jgi:hypothetical protein